VRAACESVVTPLQSDHWLSHYPRLELEKVMRALLTAFLGCLLACSFAPGQTADELTKRLKDPDATVRRLAAEALGKEKLESAIPALAERLKDSEASVRNAAADALVRIGPKSLPALQGALSYTDEASRLAALSALSRLAPVKEGLSKEGLAALTGALKDKNIDVRIHAAIVLGKLGPSAKAALPSLFDAAKDTSNLGSVIRKGLPSSVTEAAIDAALKIDADCTPALAKAALPELVAALKSKDQAVLQAAGYAIAMLGPQAKEAVPALQEAQKNANARGFAQDAIERALRNVGEEGTKSLTELIKNPKAPLEKRLSALSELGWSNAPDPKVIAIVIESLKDPEPRIRAAAVDTIGSIGPKAKAAIPSLLSLLDDAELEKAASQSRRGSEDLVASTLARMGTEAVKGLTDVVKDTGKKPLARFQATRALATMGRKAKSAIPALEAGMADKIRPIAVESACAYVRAGGDIAKATPVLKEGLKDQTPFVVWTAAHAIERIGPQAKASVPDLVILLKHSDREVRIVAARTLSIMGPDAKDAVPAIAERLKSGDGRERYHAAKALERLGPDSAAALPVLIGQLKGLEKMSPNSVLVTLGKIGPQAKSAVPALLDLLDNGDSIFGDEVMNALGYIGPDAKVAVPKLMQNLAKPSEYTRARAARALGRIGPESKAAVPELKKKLQDEKKMVRVWSAFALARITGETKPYVSLLTEIWEDSDEGPLTGTLRYDVAQAFASLGADARPARDILLQALLNEKTSIGTHEHVARALSQLTEDADVIVPKLLALLDRSGDSYTRHTQARHAMDALGYLGVKAKTAVARLRLLLEDDDNEIADAASRALARIEMK
jgi:HEAT repeat protein